jgi:hypothetical protein
MMDDGLHLRQPTSNILKSFQEISFAEIEDWGDIEEQLNTKRSHSAQHIRSMDGLKRYFSIEDRIPEENVARSPDMVHFKGQRIDIANSRATDFPLELLVTGGIYSIDISSNYLCRMDTWAAQAALKACSSTLLKLDLSKNNITFIPSQLFVHCSRLESLNLAQNLLRDITPCAALSALNHLDVSKNPFLFVDVSISRLSKLKSLSFDWASYLNIEQPEISSLFKSISSHERYTFRDFVAEYGQGKQPPLSANETVLLRGYVYDEDVFRLAAHFATKKLSAQEAGSPGPKDNLMATKHDATLPISSQLSDLLENAVSRDRSRALFVLLCFLPENISTLF